jgi:hypothetical protein
MEQALRGDSVIETSARSRATPTANGIAPGLTPEEKLTLEESLRALGYFE